MLGAGGGRRDAGHGTLTRKRKMETKKKRSRKDTAPFSLCAQSSALAAQCSPARFATLQRRSRCPRIVARWCPRRQPLSIAVRRMRRRCCPSDRALPRSASSSDRMLGRWMTFWDSRRKIVVKAERVRQMRSRQAPAPPPRQPPQRQAGRRKCTEAYSGSWNQTTSRRTAPSNAWGAIRGAA